jgi:hypothetical protein
MAVISKATFPLHILAAMLLGILRPGALAAEDRLFDSPKAAALLPSPSVIMGLADATEEKIPEKPPWWSVGDWPREKKVIALNAATVGTIAAIGFVGWDYGSHSFRTANEGWFDGDTPYGGADKLGHVFTCYTLASVYNVIYKDWGYSENDASLLGAASSWLTMTIIEIGDGFSVSEGFSWQDEVMNTVGVGMAYLRHRFPAVRERVDFRWEWFPSPSVRHGERFDVLTDYSGQKFLLAFKLDGWLRTGSPVLKALELQVGYYTRGYVSHDEDFFDETHRYGYVGIGLNVTYLLERLTGHRAWGIFDYYQMPYTYLPASWELD